MFAQEPPPDVDVPDRREPGERPELVAEVGLVEVACATGELAPVDRCGGVDREPGGGEAVGAGQPLRRDADELLAGSPARPLPGAGRPWTLYRIAAKINYKNRRLTQRLDKLCAGS